MTRDEKAAVVAELLGVRRDDVLRGDVYDRVMLIDLPPMSLSGDALRQLVVQHGVELFIKGRSSALRWEVPR